MKKIKVLTIVTAAAILSSCSTSNDVVNGGFLQKKKYNKGFNLKLKKNASTGEKAELEVAKTEVETEVEEQVIAFEPYENVEENTQKEEKKSTEYFEKKEVVNTTTASAKKSAEKNHAPEKNINRSFVFKSNTASKTSKKNLRESTTLHKAEKPYDTHGTSGASILIIILCFVLPPLAVALATGDSTQTIIAVLLTLLAWLPGIIYALIVVL